MPCGCNHERRVKGEKSKRSTPMSQCIFCAQKHCDEAYVAMNEYTYNAENRSFIHGSLRAVVNHTFKAWPSIASIARDAAMHWQIADTQKARDIIVQLIKAIDGEIRRQNPDIADRIRLAEQNPMDVIIPLGPGSVDGKDDELKILLRSLEANCKGMGRVIIVTDCPPAWLDPDTVGILPMADKYDDNKDANLIDKTLAAIEKFDVRSFVWMADDNAIMHPMDLRKAPKVYNCRTRLAFTEQKIWHERMRHTFDTFPQLTCNYDSHTPQPFHDAKKLLQCMRGVNYRMHPGLCIMTAFYAAMGELESDTEQYFCKLTVEKEAAGDIDLTSMMYLGYGDKGFPSIRARLFDIFKEPSHFERKP